MKNLKKLLAVIITVTILATSIIPAFAAGSYTYTSQAQALYDLGLYKGSSPTTFEPDLGSALDRQQGVVMLIRLLGKESAALALSSSEVESTLIIFSDAKDIASWAKKHIAYAVLYKYVAGLPNGTFAPNNPLSGKEFCTMLLRALGYTVDAAAYAGACYQLSNIGAITFAEAAKFNEKELIRDDMVGIAYGVLKAEYKTTGKTVIETMVEQKIVTEAKAISAGVYNQKLEKDARAAIEAYKTGSLNTLAEIETVEKKKDAADKAVAKIVDEATKKNLQKEIDTRAAEVAAARKGIEDADKAEKEAIAAAEAAVKAYESASLATSADVTKAEGLKKDAVDKANLVKTESSKKAFLNRIEAQDKKIADRKVDLANIADATAAVDAYLVAAYDTVEKVAEAERLGILAEEKVAKIVDTEAKASLTKKIDDHKKLVAAKKIEVSSATVTASFDNFKTVKLTFNKPVDETTLSSTTIKLNDGGKTFSLDTKKSDDKKTFILVLDNPSKQSEEIKLTIDGVKDTNGIVMDKFEKTYTVRDVVDPIIKSVEVVDAKTLRIYTSEPINIQNSAPNYSLFDGNIDTVNGTKMIIDNNLTVHAAVSQDFYKGYIQLDFQSPFSAATHTLSISGLRDYAGFAASGTFSFTITKDTAAPVLASAELIGTKKIKLTFNENIADANGNPYSYNGTFSVLEAGKTNRIGIVGPIVYKDNTVTFELDTELSLLATIGYTVYYANVSDASGNIITEEKAFATKAVDDSTPPTLASHSVEKDNTIKLVFSKKVQMPTAANFKLFYSNGSTEFKLKSGELAVYDYDTNNPDGKTYKIVITPFLASGSQGGVDAGNYVLQIGDIKDTTIRQNVMAATKATLLLNDTKLPTIAAISKISKSQTNPFTLEIYFSEKMNAADIMNKASYFITYVNSNGATVTKPLNSVANTSMSTIDNKKVVIQFNDTSADAINESNIKGVSILAKDLIGNPLTGSGAIGYEAYDSKYFVENGNVSNEPGNPVAPFVNGGINAVKATSTTKVTLTVKNDSTGVPMHLFANTVINLDSFDIRSDANSSSGISLLGKGERDLAIIGAYVSADGKTLELTLNQQLNYDGTFRKYDANGNYTDYTLYLFTTNNSNVKNTYGIKLSLTTGYKVADGIAPVQNLGFNKNFFLARENAGSTAFDPITKLATVVDGKSYLELTFNEKVKNANGSAITDMAYGLEVKVGSKTLVAGIDYYTVFNANDDRDTPNKTANGTSIYVKFTSQGISKMKNTLTEDLSNVSVRITNKSYITDLNNNAVVPR